MKSSWMNTRLYSSYGGRRIADRVLMQRAGGVVKEGAAHAEDGGPLTHARLVHPAEGGL